MYSSALHVGSIPIVSECSAAPLFELLEEAPPEILGRQPPARYLQIRPD